MYFYFFLFIYFFSVTIFLYSILFKAPLLNIYFQKCLIHFYTSLGNLYNSPTFLF